MAALADVVRAVERGYVAAATGPTAPAGDADVDVAFAAAAVAARFLAIGTPRSFGCVGATVDEVRRLLECHAVWFVPFPEIRIDDATVAAALGARHASTAEVLACDLVCVLRASAPIASAAIRSGTHLSLAPGVALAPDLAARAIVVGERADGTTPDLARIAAGFDDGRELDEVTAFVAGDLVIARGAIAALG